MRKVVIVAEWIRPIGGVSTSLLDLLRHVDYSRDDLTLVLLNSSGEGEGMVPEHVKLISFRDLVPYAGLKRAIPTLLRQGRWGAAARNVANWATARISGDVGKRMRYLASRVEALPGEYDVAVGYAMLDSFSNQYAADRVVAGRRIMWCHTHPALYGAHGLSGMERTYERFDVINCVSASGMEALVERFPTLKSKVRVRHNIIDAERIRRLAQIEVPARSGSFTLCTVARLSHEKGIDLLVEAAAHLKRDGIRFTWWVIGPDYDLDYTAAVRSSIRERGLDAEVKLLGPQANPYGYMAACDIYVQTSRIEGRCSTIEEARALGKPIITTSFEAALEQISHRVTGSVVAISAEALYQEIISLMNNPTVLSQYRAAALDVVATPRVNASEELLDVELGVIA